MQFTSHLVQSLIRPWAFQLALEVQQGDADDVAMVQAGPESFAQLQPQLVDAVHILGPQARRVRAQVDVDRWDGRG